MWQICLEPADDGVNGGLEIGVVSSREVLWGACSTEIVACTLHEEVADHETSAILPGVSMCLIVWHVVDDVLAQECHCSGCW